MMMTRSTPTTRWFGFLRRGNKKQKHDDDDDEEDSSEREEEGGEEELTNLLSCLDDLAHETSISQSILHDIQATGDRANRYWIWYVD